MCFYIRNNIESATLWVAKQDITCYKILDRELISPYQRFKYKYNKLYKVKIGRLVHMSSASNTKNGIILHPFYGSSMSIFYINKGLHSYSSKDEAKSYESDFVYKAIIPKGSEFYYDNVCREYVSNQLIIKKLINEHI